jgi:hypothetical protein
MNAVSAFFYDFLDGHLNEAIMVKVKNRSVIAFISCLEDDILDLQSLICSIKSVIDFIHGSYYYEVSTTESECRDCLSCMEGWRASIQSYSYSNILGPFENLRKITVDYTPIDNEHLDLDALVQLTPPQVKQVIVKESSWFENGVFPSLEHYDKTQTSNNELGTILCYFPRVSPLPPETETETETETGTEFTLTIKIRSWRVGSFKVEQYQEVATVAHKK